MFVDDQHYFCDIIFWNKQKKKVKLFCWYYLVFESSFIIKYSFNQLFIVKLKFFVQLPILEPSSIFILFSTNWILLQRFRIQKLSSINGVEEKTKETNPTVDVTSTINPSRKNVDENHKERDPITGTVEEKTKENSGIEANGWNVIFNRKKSNLPFKEFLREKLICSNKAKN